MLNSFAVGLIIECFLINIFEKRLLTSKHIIIPRIKIDRIKTYLLPKLIKINKNNKIIEVIILFRKLCDIKYYQSFFLCV